MDSRILRSELRGPKYRDSPETCPLVPEEAGGRQCGAPVWGWQGVTKRTHLASLLLVDEQARGGEGRPGGGRAEW